MIKKKSMSNGFRANNDCGFGVPQGFWIKKDRVYTSNSNKEAKGPIVKSFTINRSHFFSRFICRSLALVLVFTATVQAADKTTVTSAERVPNRIGIIGGRMVADMAEYGYFETALTALWTDQDITFRNLGWPADDVFGTARSEFGSGAKNRSAWKPPANADQDFGYETLLRHVNDAKPTTLLVAYGRETAFYKNPEEIEAFKRGYVTLLEDLSKVATTLILVSPPLLEEAGRPLPNPGEHNKRIQRTATFIKGLAEKGGHRLINLTDHLVPAGAKKNLTFNGQQFNQHGHERLSQVMLEQMGLAADGGYKAEFAADGTVRASQSAKVEKVVKTKNGFRFDLTPDTLPLPGAGVLHIEGSTARYAEALRMLRDPKAQRFIADFTEQWLELHKIDIVNLQAEILAHTFRDHLGEKTARLKPFMAQESIEFFKVILDENLSLLNFIDSDFVMINRPLNEIYQLELPEEEKLPKGSSKIEQDKKLRRERAFRKVTLDKESQRGGLLTQAGVLMMTTNGEFTNPFYRGAWVAKNIYGLELKTPENLTIEALESPTEIFTIKDSINAHRNQAACASCHSKMDPFGLAMENFDVLGRYRESYQKYVMTKTPEEKKDGKVVKKERIKHEFVDTTKVESDAVHRDGRAIDGMEGLKNLMLEDRDKIARNLLTMLSEYAMGREINYADSEMIHRLLAASKKNEYKMRDLMVGIIADESFTKR